MPFLFVLFLPVIGLKFSRNRGLRNSSGVYSFGRALMKKEIEKCARNEDSAGIRVEGKPPSPTRNSLLHLSVYVIAKAMVAFSRSLSVEHDIV